MKQFLLIFLVSCVAGVSVVIPPSHYISELKSFTETQAVSYTVLANSSVSIFLMGSSGFYHYSRGEAVIYDYGCSRLSVKAANVSCNYTSDSPYPTLASDVYFIIQNESNQTAASVIYTITYQSEGRFVLFMIFVSSVSILFVFVSCLIHLFCKEKVRE